MSDVCFDEDIVRDLLRRSRLPLPSEGERFGKLRVLSEFGYILSGIPRLTVACACDCGETRHLYVQYLRTGRAQSCGCVRAESAKDRAARQPYKRTRDPIYWIWRGMRQRCKPGSNVPRYSARGICVCDEWADFETFRRWAIVTGFKPGLSIDRMDNDGNYEPANCRWATAETQARNTRRNVIIEAFGERKTVSAWADDPRCKVPQGTVYARIAAGFDHERALSEPEPLVSLTAFGETKSLKEWSRDSRCTVSYKMLWQRLNMNVGFTAETAIASPPRSRKLPRIQPTSS